MQKPRKSFWQIWNMSFGFLGIQFGWGLQMANMSAIYEYLGARADQIPILVAGRAADGLAGAADHRPRERSHLETAGTPPPVFSRGSNPQLMRSDPDAALLRIVDGCGPAVDTGHPPSTSAWSRSARSWPTCCPRNSARSGFAMQSLFIGLGAVVASALPWLLDQRVSPRRRDIPQHAIPLYGSTVVLHRRRGVLRRRAVDNRHDQGISAGRYRGVSPKERPSDAVSSATPRRYSPRSARCR